MSTNETALTVRMQDLSPEYAEIMVLGKVLSMSGYFSDVRDQAQAVTKILCGRELGFSPIVSMQGIHIIEGKPALSSNLMATLIKRSGKYDYRVQKWDVLECVLMFREKVNGKWEEVGTSSFSIEEAKTAGIKFKSSNGNPTSWSKYPKAMLFARAISQGLRTYCPDVSASPIYNPEEMGAEVNEEGEVLELPKSSKPVERTTEAIPIKPISTGAATSVAGTDNQKGESVPQAPVEPSFITPKQASNIHSRFSSTLHPTLKPKADRLLDEWLTQHGFVDGERPTTKMIKADDYASVGKQIIAHAKTLNEAVVDDGPVDEFLGI